MYKLLRLGIGLMLFSLAGIMLAACDFGGTSDATPTPRRTVVPGSPRPLPPPTSLTTLDVGATPTEVASSPNATLPPSTHLPDTGLVSRVDSYLASLVNGGRFSGSVLLAQRGRALVSRGYGLADQENDVPNTPQTRFRIASLTKQFTAIGIMLLQNEGKLSIDDTVCRFVPDCPNAWQPIKLRHLLDHTSGLPTELAPADMARLSISQQPLQEGLQIVEKMPLESKPGEVFKYSNVGYNLLGFIIERASGVRYEDYLRAKVWGPLGMSDTGLDHDALVLKGAASGYAGANKAAYTRVDLAFSAGGMYSTVEDLYKWDQALYTEKLLPKSALDTVFTPNLNSYGFGWFIRQTPHGKLITHDGGLPGFVSNLSRYPDSRATVIVLSNQERAPLDEIVGELTSHLFADK